MSTLEDIRRITKKYLSEDKFVISVVQPGKPARPAACLPPPLPA